MGGVVVKHAVGVGVGVCEEVAMKADTLRLFAATHTPTSKQSAAASSQFIVSRHNPALLAARVEVISK